jgi:hypothetical protein
MAGPLSRPTINTASGMERRKQVVPTRVFPFETVPCFLLLIM